MPAHKNDRCRYCGSANLVCFLRLGDQPPSDSFVRADQTAHERRYPLDVYVCGECALVQLLDVVDPREMFGDYVYLASTSKALKAHYAQLAATITQRLNLRAGEAVVDIGCNDGVLLSGYTLPGLKRLGVDPSSAAEVAAAAGFDVVRDFFRADVARRLVAAHGRAKVVTATNVFPHVDDIGSFVAALAELLAPDGAFVIEASYLIDLIDQTLFDTIYHEHLCYLSLTPMVPFLAKYGLEPFDFERVNFGASGPALRVWVQHRGARPVRPIVAETLASEEAWGVRSVERYQGYARQVESVKRRLSALIASLRSAGARIGGYGAPAKGNTLLNYMGLSPREIESIAETNPRKQGLLTPGSHIPVVSEEEFLRDPPPYALLLTWNYLDFFLKNSAYVQGGGRFIVPLPEPRIVP